MTRLIAGVLFVLTVAFGATGCGGEATLHLRPGAPVPVGPTVYQQPDGHVTASGDITHSDATTIYMTGKHGSTGVARADVTSIDHPGETDGWVGLGLAGGGVVLMSVGGGLIAGCDEQNIRCLSLASVSLLIGLPLSITGGVLTIVGFTTHASSVDAATAGTWRIEPFVDVGPTSEQGGVAFTLVW